MQVTKTIELFQKNVVEEHLKRIIVKLDKNFRENLDELSEHLEQFFQVFIEELKIAQSEHEIGPIGFIMVSWLRTSFMTNQTLTYELHSYGADWYYEPGQKSSIQNFEWLEKFIQEFQQEVQEDIEILNNRALRQQDKYYVVIYFAVFQRYFVELVRYLFKKKGSDLISKLVLADDFRVYVGEYKAESELIYERSSSLITQNDVNYLLEASKMENAGIKQLVGVNLQNANLKKHAYPFVDFSESDLCGVNLMESILVGSLFCNSHLKRTNFQRSFIQDADFSYADCRQASFKLVKGGLAFAIEPVPCYFGVNFSHADLRGADLRGAQLIGANFENARLENALFLISQKEQFNLSQEQITSIKWV